MHPPPPRAFLFFWQICDRICARTVRARVRLQDNGTTGSYLPVMIPIHCDRALKPPDKKKSGVQS